VSDGAGAVLLMRRDVAMRKGLPILGIFRFAILEEMEYIHYSHFTHIV